MKKKETEFSYKLEVPFWEESRCFKVQVEGTASFNADGVYSSGWVYARFLNALQSGISLYTEEFLANTENAANFRKEFFEVIEPTIKKVAWGLKDVDLGIKSVKISQMNWSAKEEVEDSTGWVEMKNKSFAEQYPQTAELCLDDDDENEIK